MEERKSLEKTKKYTAANQRKTKTKQEETEQLSRREHQTLELIAEGVPTKNIAVLLNISEDTVETHRRNVLKKLCAVNAAQAVAVAFRKHLLK